MLLSIQKIIDQVGSIGTDETNQEFHRHIRLNNLNWLFYNVVLVLVWVVNFWLHVQYTGVIIITTLILFSTVIISSYYKQHLFSRNFAAFFLVFVVFINAVIYGEESKLIYFLIPILVQLFLVFRYREVKYIAAYFMLIAALYLIYEYAFKYLAAYAFLTQYGKVVSYATTPYLLIILFLMMFFIYRKNNMIDERIIFQKRYFEKILNTIPIEIIVMDHKFRYRFVNKTAIKDNELREWIIGKNDYDYVKHRNKSISIADNRFAIYKHAEEQGFTNTEEVIVMPDGTKKYTDKTLVLIKDIDVGDHLKYIGFSLDTTYKREAEELLKEYMLKLEKSNEELKQFAYITSHDLKSPLRNINSLLQLIRKKNENNLSDDSKELIDSCIKSANYLYNVVSDVLLYTTSDIDKSSFTQINLNEVLREVLKNIDNTIKEKKANIILVKDFPTLLSHKTMMFNLFANLIQNGIKYNKSEIPTVKIDYTESDNSYYFSVSDNGIGIDEKFKEQIFIVFKRLHNQSEFEGTGIGLSICKQIVENLGGTISVISKLGEGSTFYFNLPKS